MHNEKVSDTRRTKPKDSDTRWKKNKTAKIPCSASVINVEEKHGSYKRDSCSCISFILRLCENAMEMLLLNNQSSTTELMITSFPNVADIAKL